MFTGIFIILIFLFFAVLMYLNKISAILALPLMAFIISLISGVPLKDIATEVISNGAVRLNVAIITVLFGSILSQFLNQTKIAESIIKKIAEFSGENTFLTSIIVVVSVAVLFSVLGGLGSVIMVASIVLPILLSAGLSRKTAACLFLMSLGLGGIFNLTNWQLYLSVLNLTQQQILEFAIPLGIVFFLVIILFIIVEINLEGLSIGWEEKIEDETIEFVPFPAFFTPIIPILIVFSFSIYNLIVKPSQPYEFPIITAMIIGILWGFIFTFNSKNSVNVLTKSIVEGIGAVGPAVAIIIGIGMLLNAINNPLVSDKLSPIIVWLIPQNKLSFVLTFGLFAPLSLYRGPFNIWGMGAGLIAIMLSSKLLPAQAIMAALLSVGQIQGVCDPTNTHNVWIANYLDINVQDILKKTLFYMWLVAILGLIIGAIFIF